MTISGRGGVRVGRPSLHVLEDVEFLANDIRNAKTPGTKVGISVEARRSIALRLGMTEEALRQAIYRGLRHRQSLLSQQRVMVLSGEKVSDIRREQAGTAAAPIAAVSPDILHERTAPREFTGHPMLRSHLSSENS